jgi:uncharacterized repeat protein (TIGR03803 family)
MVSRKQLGELSVRLALFTEDCVGRISWNRIIMVAVAASLLAITAVSGKAAEITSLGSQTHSLSDLGYEAVSESVLWSFGATGDDAVRPFAGLIADKWGNLYGTTVAGGVHGLGTAFELSPPSSKQPQWSERVLWSFGATSDDGQQPSGLIADKWGNLYGTTNEGGAYCPSFGGCGTVFELIPPAGRQPRWSERVLWSFGATSNDSAFPRAGLIADKWGNLYGTTIAGGASSACFGSGCGTVFELSPPSSKQPQWSERVLWSFAASNEDGSNPVAALIADK